MFIKAFTKPASKLQDKNSKPTEEKIRDILELTCHICAHPYDSLQKIPISICQQQHTFCALCVDHLFKSKPYSQKCPTCRVHLCKNSTLVNKTLLRICDRVAVLAHNQIQKDRQRSRIEQELAEAKNQISRLRYFSENQEKENINIENRKQKRIFPKLTDIENIKGFSKIDVGGFLARQRIASIREQKAYDKKEGQSFRNHIRSIKQ